ncbi:MAG: NifU family protein [Myxococcota bacterium]
MDEPILALDEAAAAKLKTMKDAGRFDGSALRVTVSRDGAAFHYQLEVVEEETASPEDAVIDAAGIRFYVDAESVPRLRGATLQYVDAMSDGGFRFENPNQPELLSNPIAARVQRLLDERINPSVADHGGHVSLVDVQEGRVFLRFGGGCQGCGMVDVTLKEGIQAQLMAEIPEITQVLDETDHAAGTNPYYEPGH